MNSDGVVFDGERIKQLIVEVADELVGGEQHVIIVVGGSLLAWHGLREATQDIDSIRELDYEMRAAVRRVAERHRLAHDWLNDHAKAFAPTGFDTEACEILLDTPRLKVLGAPFRDVFLMKLRRGDPQDLIDMRALWPHLETQFASAKEVVGAFFQAFPDEPEDAYLSRLVADELAKDGITLPLD